MSFWTELRRRNVFKVGAAYAVLAWLLLQVASVIFPALQLPSWTITFVTLLLLIGFPIAVFLAWAYEMTPEGIQRTEAASSGSDRPTGQGLNYVLTALLVAALAFIAVDRFWLNPTGADTARGGATVRRLAVLPCDDLSPDTTNAYFAPGIHGEIINRLAQVSGLRVISRSSVLQYAENRPSIPTVGQQLNVDSVMECSVRYDGDRLMLTAQLIDAVEDTHLWSQAYPADMGNLRSLFEIQGDIAMNVANAIRVEFLDSDIERIEQLPTESREAYELLLAARGIPLRTLDSGERALELVGRALALDPEFTEAWAMKSNLHNIVSTLRAGPDAARELALGRESALRVLELDPGSGEGHTALGFALQQRGEWLEAEREYRRGFELGVARAQVPAYSILQMVTGNFPGARATLEANLDVDPMNQAASGFVLATYEVAGDRERRREAFARGEELFGNWFGDAIERYLRIGDGTPLESLSPIASVSSELFDSITSNLDDPQAALAAMRAYYAIPENRTSNVALYLATWAARFGDSVQALEWLGEAARVPANTWFMWLPAFENVRRAPGFEAFVDRLRLPEHWNEFGWPTFCQPTADEFECS